MQKAREAAEQMRAEALQVALDQARSRLASRCLPLPRSAEGAGLTVFGLEVHFSYLRQIAIAFVGAT